MGRERVKMKLKLKRRPKELPRKVHDSTLQHKYYAYTNKGHTNKNMKHWRMTGKDLDGLSFEELLVLRNHLNEVMLIVTNQKDKIRLEKAERLRQQKKEAGDENEGTRRRVLVPCRYGCSSEDKLQEQDNEAGLREEVERLRFLIKRMTGRDDGVSFAELLALESHLNDVRRIVLDQKEKIKLEEDERKKEAEHEANGTRRGVLVPPTSRLVERQKKPNGLAPLLNMKREFERRISEPLQSEFERLWLFNERMNGRELEGMTSLDLTLLHSQILGALKALNDQTFGPRVEQRARQRGEV
ncbi:PREDICTED: uncharacterized protein LOC104784344 [Camelina sativa]|uniref:Uncharacterized protein LOC104784344 n=1 Tax=Camelina sativa TaxID=90675 RepID=A0ABM1RLA2_CAMSA|nr:PREDICTED: uncharacterized protein LOC104784344 [Camelina sativa]